MYIYEAETIFHHLFYGKRTVIVSLPIKYNLFFSSKIYSSLWEFPLVICGSELIFLFYFIFLHVPVFLYLALLHFLIVLWSLAFLDCYLSLSKNKFKQKVSPIETRTAMYTTVGVRYL